MLRYEVHVKQGFKSSRKYEQTLYMKFGSGWSEKVTLS